MSTPTHNGRLAESVRRVPRLLALVAVVLGFARPVAAQIGAASGPLGPAAVQFLAVSGRDGGTVPIEAASVALLRRRLTVNFDALPLADALREIGTQAGVRFAYLVTDVPVGNRITLQASGITLAGLLTEVLMETGVDVVVSSGEQLALVRRNGSRRRPDAATGWVVGFVTDSASNVPVEAAEVFIDSLRLRGTTNLLGRYRLAVPAGKHRLGVRRIGYRGTSQQIEVTDSATVVADFTLVPAPTRLQDLVATATGPQRRYELGNAIALINADSVVATQPVHSVAELLETRVPGLTATHTSGAPGDPTRLRLRGLNSVTRSNDPIVIVDGVRIYAEQSDMRANNLAVTNPFDGRPIRGRPNTGENLRDQVATRSPLDQIDVHSIARVEVFKGPSASTLYGADAANGVIVITTKRGQAGETHWTFGSDYATTHQPGKYPDSYLRLGHDVATGTLARCPLVSFGCVVDSLVRYQVLNDPALTPFGRGHRQGVNLGVSGGTAKVTYALTGSVSDETGLLKLPDYEVRRYQLLTGARAPEWMRRPHGLSDWSGTGHLSVELSPKATLSFTSAINRSKQRRSTLESQLSTLQALYADTINNRFYPGLAVNVGIPGSEGGNLEARPTLTTGFRTRTTATSTSFTQAASLIWRPLGWLSTTADLGLNLVDRSDESTEAQRSGDDPYFDFFGTGTGQGFFNVGTGNSTVTTANLGAVAIAPLGGASRLRTAVGGNFTRSKTTDLIASGTELIPGATGLEGARVITTTPERSEITTFGWYIEPTLEHKRFFLSTGLRLDGADTYGSKQSLAGFPKVSLSYLLSEEPFFPFKKVFSTLRLRAAYGQAGVQPGPGDRLRLYQTTAGWLGGFTDQTDLTALGNVHLKPERSSEFEGGIDADLFGDKVTLELTAYRKTRFDALVPLTLPYSANGGGTVLVNIGEVRNTGIEIGIGTNLVRSDFVTLNTQFHISKNRNLVLSTGDAGDIEGPGGTRVVKGYPLFGRWAKPIVGFADVNQDGIISRSEVQLGDAEVFLGASEPDYEAALYTNLSLFRGLMTVSTGFSYTNGQLQVNETLRDNPFTVRGANDPSAPLAEQAAVVVREETPYGLAQVLSTLRFNSLAISFNAPERIARALGTRNASLTVQGTNLGLWTNYRGRDPSVNAYATGNVIADTGQLPLPQTWSFGIRFGF